MKPALRRVPTLLVAVPLLAGVLAAPAEAAPPDPVAGAAAWLSTQFVDGSHLPSPSGDHFDSKYGSSYFPNYGENADVLFALAGAKAAGGQATVALDYLDKHLADYADPSGTFGGPFDGSIAKVALAHLVAGRSATELLTKLQSDECPASSSSCTPGAPANIFASASDSFVILAEARAGESFAPSPAAVDYFLSLQCSNGGFTTGTEACGSGDADIDATSYAVMALQALGGHATELGKAADWLAAQRQPAGYWISQHIPNTDSTGLAAAALAGAGRNVSTSRSWLLDQQVAAGQPGAGSLNYAGKFTPTTTSATSPNVIATAQGILGLVDDGSLATVSATGGTSGVELFAPVVSLSPARQTEGGTATAHGVGFAAGENVTATVAEDTVGVGTVDASGVVDVSFEVPLAGTSDGLVLTGSASGLTAKTAFSINGAPGGPPTSTPPTSAPPLANTGADSSELLAVGLAALVSGTGLIIAARQRRRGRHAA